MRSKYAAEAPAQALREVQKPEPGSCTATPVDTRLVEYHEPGARWAAAANPREYNRTVATDCRHRLRIDGICLGCGQCQHELILNHRCYGCGASDVAAAGPKPTPAVVPESRLRRSRDRDNDS